MPTPKTFILTISILLSAAGFTQAQPMVGSADSSRPTIVATGRSRAASKEPLLSKLPPMPTNAGGGTLAEVQSPLPAIRYTDARHAAFGSAETSLDGLPQIVRALPEQTTPALPEQIVLLLHGQLVGALSGQVVRALPGQIVPPLPGQIVAPLPGQIIR